MTIAVIHGSTRPNGNTELLTEHAVRGLDIEHIYLRNHRIEPIIDMRHAEEGFFDRDDDYNEVIDRVLQHDVLIFATPIYWYSMSGIMKNFVDRWSHTMRDAKYPDFKAQLGQKKAYVIAVGGDDPYVKGLPMIQQFKHIFDFMGISFEGYVLGKGSRPQDVLQDTLALSNAAELYNKLNS
jgi:multimeric flavodoxin WrbA